MNYPELAFSEAAKTLQTRFGSRSSYARMEKFRYTDGLTDAETAFISGRDHFYMATTGTNGYPYVQHRGGPAGFVKVLSESTLGFLDFSGNQQFISAGNLMTNPKASLLFMDYATRTRLKLYVDIKLVDLAEHPDVAEQLKLPNYPARPQRAMLAAVQAYDWNCPQHITPRYTAEEVNEVFNTQQLRIQQLEQQLKTLQEQAVALPQSH